jgi:hypothetical protein
VRATRLRRALRWVGRAAALLTAPLWAPALLVGLATELAFLPGEWRVRRMRRAGRWLPRAELRQRLRRRAGTLIVEWPAPGFRYSRAWWASEVIGPSARGSPGPPGRGFARWCHGRYTDLGRGAALLVAVWGGERVARRLERRFPGVGVVRYCSFFPGLTGPDLAQHSPGGCAEPDTRQGGSAADG